MDSLILCKFLRGVFADFYTEASDMLRKVTGWDVTAVSFARPPAHRRAKRRGQPARGVDPRGGYAAGTFPDYAVPGDPAAALTHDCLQELVTEYHRQRGWTIS